MKNINFDNPYLLLLAIPVALAIIIPYFVAKNKDNKAVTWLVSLCIHAVIIVLVALAAAGLSTISIMTETTVYVVADVSYSSDKNLDEIDAYIQEINENLPEKSKLGIVCFAKDYYTLTSPGRTIKSVKDLEKEVGITDYEKFQSETDIVGALNFTGKLFRGDSLKRIVLITDGNDTLSGAGSIASTVERLTDEGIKIDAIFLNNAVSEDETEIQLLEAEYPLTTYLNHENEVKILVQASKPTDVTVELYVRDATIVDSQFEKLGQTVISADSGLTTVKMNLPTDTSGAFEYQIKAVNENDLSKYNNVRTFQQTVAGREKILHITGSNADVALIEAIYGEKAEIEAYLVSGANNKVPFTVEELVNFDEIIISNVDVKEIRNVNALIDSLDMVVSQYGKSLVTYGNLQLQTNIDDPVYKKFQELLPVTFGSTKLDGRLYTIVLDVSHSMFMASKFTIAKNAAKQLITILDDDDYVCLVTFSGEIKVETPKKVRDCKNDLINYINGLSTGHGTDIGKGLEEALNAVKNLNLSENQVMVISDGFSFEDTRSAEDVAKELYDAGATVSGITTYIASDQSQDGRNTMKSIVNAGDGGKYYEISRPEDVDKIVFGTVAEEFTEVVLERDAVVTIAKRKDDIVKNITSLPVVSGYILSLAKYDATVPLTITYQKNNGYQETVPFYAYRSHGNGKVSSLTSDLSGAWTGKWSLDTKTLFVENLIVSNVPKDRVDYPFNVLLEKDEKSAYLEISPSVLNPEAEASIVITLPGKTPKKRTLTFDSNKYTHTFTTGQIGVYKIDITYKDNGREFTTTRTFEIPYMPEYNAFAVFDKFKVYEFIRGNGEVVENGIPNLENDESEITTYKVSFVIPLLIAAVSLFVIDVFVRKLRIKKKVKKGELKK